MLISRNKRKEDADKRLMIKFQFVELNGRLMWCDFGANLVQHFIGRYSRYSRYRTKTHDKCTISHVFPRSSRYQTVLSKLKEIIIISYIQKLCFGRAFCFCMAVQFVKKMSRPIYFLGILWYNYLG